MKESRRLILASGSPRRRDILTQVGIPFLVEPSDLAEVITESEPDKVVMELARQKAMAVALRHPYDAVLGADTVVSCDGRIFGKPADETEACAMLDSLQGRSHVVYTGVAFAWKGEIHVFAEQTKVFVRNMEPEEIAAYVKTGEPYDKAGSYAIQGMFARFIEGIEGDYYNAIGLPICRVCTSLKEMQLL